MILTITEPEPDRLDIRRLIRNRFTAVGNRTLIEYTDTVEAANYMDMVADMVTEAYHGVSFSTEFGRTIKTHQGTFQFLIES